MFCDKHNDDSQCLMLLPTSQLSIPITLVCEYCLVMTVRRRQCEQCVMSCVMCGATRAVSSTHRGRKIENIDQLIARISSVRASLPVP